MLASSSITVDPSGKCSLAFKQLRDVPSQMVFQALSSKIIELDLSHNNLTDLSDNVLALENLTSLVLDHNRIHSASTFNGGKPLPKITLLWVNSNKIKDLKQFVEKVAFHFPNLKIFSMLKNEACPNFFTGGSAEEYEQYRLFVISRLNNLTVLDSSTVTKSEREIGKKMYGSPDAVPSYIKIQQQAKLEEAEQARSKTVAQQQPSSNLPNFASLGQNNNNRTAVTVSSQPSFNLPTIDNLQSTPQYVNPSFNNNNNGYFNSNSNSNTQYDPYSQGGYNNYSQPTNLVQNPQFISPQPPMPPSSQGGGMQLPSLDSLAQPNTYPQLPNQFNQYSYYK